jgi:predicted MFS family arabinose efflux permease
MCFLLNGVSYLAVIVALLAMRVTRRVAAAPAAETPPMPLPPLTPALAAPHPLITMLHELREGFAYAYGSRPIKYSLFLLAFLSLLAMPFGVLMPMIVQEVLHGGPQVFGLLMAVSGVGAVIGALYLAGRPSALGLERWMAAAPALFGVALMAFSRSDVVVLSAPLILVVGFGTMVQIAATNTVLQTVVEDDKRGRVMSLYSVVFMGTAPFGSLLAGLLASKVGAADTLLINGACALIASLLFLTRLPAMTRSLRAHAEQAATAAKALSEVAAESRLAAGGD